MSIFVHMKNTDVHRGEIVDKMIRQKGINLTTLAKEIKVNRQTLYLQLDRKDMATAYILKIGEKIGVDFSAYIPGLNEEILPEVLHDNERADYSPPQEPLQVIIQLDGTERTLQQVLDRLIRVNKSLQMESA